MNMGIGEEVLQKLFGGIEETLPLNDLKQRLESGKKLRVKAGFDPTAPDIHLGHTVLFNKLRQFQEAGHQVIFLIGDFTARIGDPTGKNVTRPPLSQEEIKKNVETYQEQAFKILDPQVTEVRYNSEWLDKLTSADVLKLASTCTVARMLEREDFHKRYKENSPIAIHEFLYPLLQGYDSVILKADVELGGTDQKFNLLMGRELQKYFGQKPQAIITLPLLEGLDGKQKMSKSLGNYIGVNENACEMYGKLMSISDELMWRYYLLLSNLGPVEIGKIQQEMHPRDAKAYLSRIITTRYHGQSTAQEAENDFNLKFRDKSTELNLETIELNIRDESVSLLTILKQMGLLQSTSEGMRLIQQGAIKVNQERISSKDYALNTQSDPYLIQIGKKKYAKIKLKMIL